MTVKRTAGTPPNTSMADAFSKAGVGASKPASSSRHQDTVVATQPKQEPAAADKIAPAAPAAKPQAEQQPQTPIKETTMSQQNTQDYADSRRGAGSDNGPQNFLGEAGAQHRRPMSRHFGDQRANSIITKLKDLAEKRISSDGVTKFNFALLASDSTGLPLSVILITQSGSVKGQLHGSIFSLFIESEDMRLPTFSEKDGQGQSVDIPRTTSDIVNSREYWKLATSAANSMIGTATWREAGSERIAPVKHENEEYYLTALLFQATRATFSTLSNQIAISQEKPYTLIRRNPAEQLTARLNTQAPQLITLNNEPVRSDIVIELNSGKSGDSFIANERMITEVRGFIEPFMAQAPVAGSNETQPLFPMFIMTGLESGYDALDREMVALGITTMTLIENWSAWAGQYRPRFRQNLGKQDADGIQLNDVSAVGYLLTGDRLNIREETQGSTFGDAINLAFRPRPVYAIDIPEMGGNAWAFDPYRASAAGVASATEALIESFDNLTGNKFSALWSQYPGARIIDSMNTRIPTGYYIDPKTQIARSLYDVDQLAVMNVFGKSNPKAAFEWAETYDPKGKTPNLRMHKRLTIMDEVLGTRMHVTGMSDRYVFTSLFTSVLAQACAAAGLAVQPGNIAQAGLSGGSIMGGFDISGYAAQNNGSGGIFTGNQNANAGGLGYNGARSGWAS